MKAVILAGGLGMRLKPFTEIVPKPLLPIGEKSVLEIQIQRLKQSGFDELYLATNYMAEYIESYLGDGSRFGVSIKYSKETKPLGTCGPLALLKRELDTPFLVMNGDILTKLAYKKLFDFGCQQTSLLTIATKVITTPFRFGNVRVDRQDYVISVEEKPELNFEVLAGIYLMKPEILTRIQEDTYFGMDQLIKNMLSEGEKISRYEIKEYWLDIGQVEDYSQARKTYDEHFSE